MAKATNVSDKANAKRVEEIAEAIDIKKSQQVLAYGLKAQTTMADFSGNLLDQMRSVKTGDIELPLQMLLENVRAVDISDLRIDDNYRRFARKAKRAIAGYNKADKRIFTLELQLDEIRGDLLRDVLRLEKLKEKSKTHRAVLQQYIVAGEKVLSTMHKDKQKLTRDEQQQIIRLEKRVHDLKLSHTVGLQFTTQVDMIVVTNKMLIEKIQSSLINTIPLWRSQMTLTQALLKQKTAQNMQALFVKQANAALGQNAQALQEAVKQGKDPMEALQAGAKQILQTLDDVKQVYKNSEGQINQALNEMTTLKEQL